MEQTAKQAKLINNSQRRLQGWDDAASGLYFVTICTQKRQWFFGKITDGEMLKNQMGEIAQKDWLSIPAHHKNVILDEFIVMPNHIHGILYLTDRDNLSEERNVATLRATSLPNQTASPSDYFSKISPKGNSLSAIIRSFKVVVTRDIHRKVSESFAWQPRFYDHIIRKEEDLLNLREYIHLNPENWWEPDEITSDKAPAHA